LGNGSSLSDTDFPDQGEGLGWPILEIEEAQVSAAEGNAGGLILESRPMPILPSAEAQPVALAFHRDHMAVMEEAVPHPFNHLKPQAT
jgi:hypothetical protein